jgi:hypothetical protein
MLMPTNQARFMQQMHRTAQAVEIQRQIDLLKQAVASLNREGHAVLAAGIGPGKPVVHLAPSMALSNLASVGQAAYYMRGTDEHGQHFRKGVLTLYRNVQVTWKETGH